MEKSVEKANFATGVSRSSENTPVQFLKIDTFLAQDWVIFMFYQ